MRLSLHMRFLPYARTGRMETASVCEARFNISIFVLKYNVKPVTITHFVNCPVYAEYALQEPRENQVLHGTAFELIIIRSLRILWGFKTEIFF